MCTAVSARDVAKMIYINIEHCNNLCYGFQTVYIIHVNEKQKTYLITKKKQIDNIF